MSAHSKQEKFTEDVDLEESKEFASTNVKLVKNNVGMFVKHKTVMEKKLEFVKDNVKSEKVVIKHVWLKKLDHVGLIEQLENGFKHVKESGEMFLSKNVLKNVL